jgi:hypothetical protein
VHVHKVPQKKEQCKEMQGVVVRASVERGTALSGFVDSE